MTSSTSISGLSLNHAYETGGLERVGHVVFTLLNGGVVIGYDIMVTMEGDNDVHPYRVKVRGEDLKNWTVEQL